MEKNSSFAKLVFVLALIATIIGFTAFSQTPEGKNDLRKQQSSKNNDTSRSANRKRNDGERGLEQLDIQLKKLDRN
ncbi:MAG: hypothetical protein ACR2KZ_20385, partial [Segetibacter sp.]